MVGSSGHSTSDVFHNIMQADGWTGSIKGNFINLIRVAPGKAIEGFFICLLLALGWALSSFVRSKEIRRLKDNTRYGNSFAFLCYDINDLEHANQFNLPRVTVVMPLKGFGEHNIHNWRTQITSLYGGPLEFLFVVESIEDPAYMP